MELKELSELMAMMIDLTWFYVWYLYDDDSPLVRILRSVDGNESDQVCAQTTNQDTV